MDCMRMDLNAKATSCGGSSSLKAQSRVLLLSKSASLIQE